MANSPSMSSTCLPITTVLWRGYVSKRALWPYPKTDQPRVIVSCPPPAGSSVLASVSSTGPLTWNLRGALNVKPVVDNMGPQTVAIAGMP